jgi:hypothetical protein
MKLKNKEKKPYLQIYYSPDSPKENKIYYKPGAGGSHLQSQLYGRLRLGRLLFKAAWAQSSRDPHLQNNHSKMDGRCGSSGRATALQAQSSELKSQSNPPLPPKNLLQYVQFK